MSEAAPALELLSREEIGALVEEMRRAREQEHEARRLPGLGDDASAPGPGRALRRGLERFAVAVSRALASRFQRRLELRLLEIDDLRAGDLADLLLPHDRVVPFDDAAGARGFLLVARPLALAWMRLCFGATTGLRVEPLPDRAPTPIELRFLRRTAAELLAELGQAIGGPLAMGAVEDATALRDQRAARLAVATFELGGLEEIGRIRLALPREARIETPVGARAVEAGAEGGALERAVLDAEVDVTVSAGATLVPLARIAHLAVGETFAIESARDGLVTVAVDGTPKFHAQRGQLGSRLAVQVVERIESAEE
jgi:flagellar motor switch protein FliM